MPAIPSANFRTWLLAAFIVFALSGFWATPYDPSLQQFRDLAFAGPQWGHWFGIDGLGRDFASRLWSGLGNTVGMAAGALGLNLILALSILALERTLPPELGRMVPLLISIWVAVPVIFIGLILLVFLGPSAGTLVLAVAVGNVPFAFRQLRVLWQEHRSALYVEASTALGGTLRHTFGYAIWPNLRPDFFALCRLIFAICVLELSGLAFLGLIGDPDFPELGAILRQNQAYLFQRSALVLWPGLLLCGLLLAVHSGSQADSR